MMAHSPQIPGSLDEALDERLRLNAAAADNATDRDGASSISSAPMPPSMAEKKQYTADELYAELNKVPLFMTSLDESAESGDNDMLEALKALAYEGTRAEIASNFREQGNDAAKTKQWSDARLFYTKALAALKGPAQPQDPDEGLPDVRVVEVDEEAEAKRERDLEEACLVNRALCNLEMKNYGQCNKDLATALKLNPRNVKAWYRASSACLALDKLPEALDACQSGLRFDPANAALKSLLTKIEKRQTDLTEQERSRKERVAREAQEAATLKQALIQRKIKMRTTPDPPDLEDAKVSLADRLDASSVLSMPLLFLYPLEAQTDLIKAVREDESWTEHMAYMLPLPWDVEQEYKLENLDCYVETITAGLNKVGKLVGFGRLLAAGNVEFVDGMIKLYIVPKTRAAGWIEEFKKRRGKQ